MTNLFTLNELYTSGFKSETLDIIALLVTLCGIFIIIAKNPIVSILFLIALFGGIASYLILLGLSFIGFSYLIVYVGAVSILFLFILMLINIRISELQTNPKNSIALALFVGIYFNFTLFDVLPYATAKLNSYISYVNDLLYTALSQLNMTKYLYYYKNDNLLFATSNNWEGNLVETSHISSIGNILYTSYNIWLILTSFILVLAMVGAIVITIKSKNN